MKAVPKQRPPPMKVDANIVGRRPIRLTRIQARTMPGISTRPDIKNAVYSDEASAGTSNVVPLYT